MYKGFSWMVLFLVTLSIGAAWSLAGDLNDDLTKLLEPDKGDNASKPAVKPSAAPMTTKDPVELALAIPKKFHIKYDQLRKDQKTAYDKMKKQYAPKLKDAMQKVQDAAEADKSMAIKEVKTLKKAVRKKIVAILNQRDPTIKSVRKQSVNPRYSRYPYN